MQTLHLTNQPLRPYSSTLKIAAIGVILCTVYLSNWLESWTQAVSLILFILLLLLCSYLLIKNSTVAYTLTATHFQQHLAKGGWSIKWNNISKIGVVHDDSHGWQQPLPWVGIKLKDYTPYLQSVCPRLIPEILMDQRALLYLGAQRQRSNASDQTLKLKPFEDMVLDSTPYQDQHGHTFSGLQAMIANRMRYQRHYHDYDLFIAAADLERGIEEFVGLARRYLAAAEPD